MPGSEFDEFDKPLPGEPEGWRELQQRARNARNGKELEAIIAEMNRLLTEIEKRAATGDVPHPASHDYQKTTLSDL